MSPTALYVGYTFPSRSLARRANRRHADCLAYGKKQKNKKKERENDAKRHGCVVSIAFRSRSDVTTACPAAAADPFRGFTFEKKKERNRPFPRRLLSYYLFVGRQAFRVFNHLVSSCFCFSTAPCYAPFFSLAHAINFLFDISLYIIKLSYYGARIRFSLRIVRSIRSFIRSTSFNAASYPRVHVSSLLPPAFLLTRSLHRLCFFVPFFFIQTRMSLSSTALRRISRLQRPVHAITKQRIPSYRLAREAVSRAPLARGVTLERVGRTRALK